VRRQKNFQGGGGGGKKKNAKNSITKISIKRHKNSTIKSLCTMYENPGGPAADAHAC